jgi:hypothetical protein
LTVDRVSGAAFAVFSALVLWESSKIPFGTLADPGPGALPMLLGSTLLACSLFVMLAGTSARLDAIEWSEWRHGVAILGTLVFMALAMETLGYRVTIFGGLFVLVAVVERKGWVAGMIFAAAFAFGTYGLFHTLLHVQLPRGVFGF